ncbi:MAG: selenocysteine-specific translation elongation factor [Armatimonadetes bacterium]|nr:selenocysteine-specific translation elongation factor [Armatimonadota bacterium]MDW8153442.1 selenocysteine-specific translation elongation factor [Armatimonadota bacterium]
MLPPSSSGSEPIRAAVVGTAGHVDHGKSTLVYALTGIDPDRLEEEKRRGMTIDLGFAHMDLPSGVRVGFVDVPGHERLIRNMLAGAAGFDAVMLVVASDEGVMPQTREHVDILRFLRIPRGVVALTKRDLVDEEWLELVQEDVRSFLAETFLENAPIVPVSAKTGEGLAELVAALDRVVASGSPRPAEGPVRLPVDRSFQVAGWGTVVTGTLWSGRIRPDDTLQILPSGRTVRVRGIQSHGRPVPEVRAGQRVALNLLGISREEVGRGDVLVTPGAFEAATSLDVRLQLLPGTPALRHGDRVRLYLGTAEAIGRAFLLEGATLSPGAAGFAHIRLEQPITAAFGDPFVIRRPSPMLTWGGGEVLQVNPPRSRRQDPTVLVHLRILESQDPEGVLLLAVESSGTDGSTLPDLVRRTGMAAERLHTLLLQAQAKGLVWSVRDRWIHGAVLHRIEEEILQALSAYHRTRPWRRGLPQGEWLTLIRRLGGAAWELAAERVAHRVVTDGGFVRLPDHHPVLTPDQARAVDELRSWLERSGLEGPSRTEVEQALGARAEVALQFLLDAGEALELRGLLYHRKSLERAIAVISEALHVQASLTVAAVRDLLGTSRKYVLPLLEYLDTVGVTRRQGDLRVPGPKLVRGAC